MLAHHPNNVQITQKDKRKNRNFCVAWFQRTDWLTSSVERNSLLCFPCLLFGGDTAWTQQGIVDFKHLYYKIRKHECSTSPIGNVVKLALLGKVNIACQLNEGHRCTETQWAGKKKIKKNKSHSLSWLVDCIKFCGRHKLALRESDESPTSLQGSTMEQARLNALAMLSIEQNFIQKSETTLSSTNTLIFALVLFYFWNMVLQIVAGTVLFYNVVVAQLACAVVYRGGREGEREREREREREIFSIKPFLWVCLPSVAIERFLSNKQEISPWDY